MLWPSGLLCQTQQHLVDNSTGCGFKPSHGDHRACILEQDTVTNCFSPPRSKWVPVMLELAMWKQNKEIVGDTLWNESSSRMKCCSEKNRGESRTQHFGQCALSVLSHCPKRQVLLSPWFFSEPHFILEEDSFHKVSPAISSFCFLVVSTVQSFKSYLDGYVFD